MIKIKPLINFTAAALSVLCAMPAWSKCLETGVQLQILGSGGPGAASGRASSGYLLWVDGVSRVMVDAGSGTKDQFHQAGANSADIKLVALSHLHPDHSAELPAIFWPDGGSFRVSGPTGAGVFPSLEQFLSLLFEPNGVYSVLGPRLDLDVLTVDAQAETPTQVWQEGSILVSGKGVPHGDVPTIAYKFELGETSIVFASDQNGSDPQFIDFMQGADYLLIHLAATETATGVIAELHAKPSVWGEMAAAAGVGHVIVSHITAQSPLALEESLTTLRNNYLGPLTIGEDLMCVEL